MPPALEWITIRTRGAAYRAFGLFLDPKFTQQAAHQVKQDAKQDSVADAKFSGSAEAFRAQKRVGVTSCGCSI